ncbi:hypothetical protein B0H34DRAFT_811826 [Crassisporium funariophilum]|nr:hypothetical protein B0H34DRAFT_811826 [Crassisporium funariophilum]
MLDKAKKYSQVISRLVFILEWSSIRIVDVFDKWKVDGNEFLKQMSILTWRNMVLVIGTGNPRVHWAVPVPLPTCLGLFEKSRVQRFVPIPVPALTRALYPRGLTSYKAICKCMGLLSTRQQKQTLETIREVMVDLQEQYPLAGARDMVNHIFHRTGMKVSHALIVVYFRVWEPELVRQRKAGRLKRRRFWAAGPNDLLAVDQHDKWKRFGLALHTGVDPFSGRIQWIEIWWTNSNPKLILSYYLDMPLVTQSDLGSENYGIANGGTVQSGLLVRQSCGDEVNRACLLETLSKAQAHYHNGHTAFRHWHDPNLVGTIQHRWMRQKKNVKPEITWSQLRRRFTPGFEDILDFGVNNGLYDTNLPLHVFVFCWIFIPFLQTELNAWKDLVNNTKKGLIATRCFHMVYQTISIFFLHATAVWISKLKLSRKQSIMFAKHWHRQTIQYS